MRRMSKTFGLLIVLTICLFTRLSVAQYGGGTGEPNDPYLIYTAEQMNAIGAEPNDWDKHFKLMADIDLSNYDGKDGRTAFNIIAPDINKTKPWSQGKPFTGVFDGNDKKISNFNYTSIDTDYIGLFGYVYDPNSQIKDLGLIDPNVDAGQGNCIGLLVGWLRKGAITNCYTQGGKIVGVGEVGGLVGKNGFLQPMGRAWNPVFEVGILKDCYSTSNVIGKNEVGGLVGSNYGTMTNCFANGTIDGEQSIGGLVGTSANIIKTCYSNVTVSGSKNVGGLVGYNWVGSIFDCNSVSTVVGEESTGGLIGRNGYRNTVTNCNATSDVMGTREVGGLTGTNNGDITNCGAAGSVSGTWKVGGLTGYNNSGNITNTYSMANINGNDYVGGLIGSNSGTITNGYSSGSVTGRYNVGGLIGSNSRIVINCYSIGAVVGEGNVGGLLGCADTRGGIVLSFWDVETSGQLESRAGTGKTTAEMQTSATFRGWGACVNEGIWIIDEGRDYPRLSWEEKPGEIIGPIQLSDFLIGAGTEDDSYLIYTAEQLNVIGLFPCDWDKHFKLMTDIDMSDYSEKMYNIIGTGLIPFTGTFDGNNHTILNFNYTSNNRNFLGLFGFVDTLDAQIRNLGLIDPNVDAGNRQYRQYYTGGIVGYLNSGILTNCYAENVNMSGYWDIGGLVGVNQGSVVDCYSSGNVNGNHSIGILIGHNFRGSVKNCHSNGSATGGTTIGGLIGSNSGNITDSYSSCNISGEDNVGGLVGSNGGTIINCYSTGQIEGWEHIGGLAGSNFTGTIENSYSTVNVSGKIWTGGLTGGNYEGTIISCCSKGNVHGGSHTGGLVGLSYQDASITNCYSSGDVYGHSNVGGLVGSNVIESVEMDKYVSSKIANCYSISKVTGSKNVGALVGDNSKGEVTSSFWDIETSGQSNMCGIEDSWTIGCDDSFGKTTFEMQAASMFLNVGWDFIDETENGTENIWWILEDRTYPRLMWESPEAASLSYPPDDATDVIHSPVLSWYSGIWAVDHDVYFGEDEKVVKNATIESVGIYRGRQPGKVTTYDPGTLKWGKTYYWRIDEINEDDFNNPWKGNVWSFTTADFLLVDDFESYNDLDSDDPESNKISDVWLDGLNIPEENGAIISYDFWWWLPDFLLVPSSTQSMRLKYINYTVSYSEATANVANLVIGHDWTKSGVQSLSLWFYGLPANALIPMYIVVADANGSSAIVYHDNPNETQMQTWTEWKIDLQVFADQGVDLNNVNTISIGFGDKNNLQTSGSGSVFFDNIRLYRPAPQEPEP